VQWSRYVPAPTILLQAPYVYLSFFAYRVHMISERWFVSIIAWCGRTVGIETTLMIVILTMDAENLPRYEKLYPWPIILSLVVAMATENTSTLCYYLHQIRTEFKGWVPHCLNQPINGCLPRDEHIDRYDNDMGDR
jgi:hypothetical protein